MTDTIKLWHGSRAWAGSPEIRAPKGGRAEVGAGIYCTTSYLRARSYAKGGGQVMLIEVDPDMRLLEHIKVKPEVLMAAARAIPRLKSRDQILADIERCAERGDGRDTISLNVLLNLAVNSDACVGQPAVAITEFMVNQGADATIHTAYGAEDWLVVYNPAVIKAYTPRPAAQVDVADYDLPRVAAQLAEIRERREQWVQADQVETAQRMERMRA